MAFPTGIAEQWRSLQDSPHVALTIPMALEFSFGYFTASQHVEERGNYRVSQEYFLGYIWK